VNFEDKTVSPDPANQVTGWLWDFGDGTTSTEKNPTHSYAEAGSHSVTLTLTFANGAVWSTTMPVKVDRGSGVQPVQPPTDACTATASSKANLRGGPGTGFDVVGGVAAGDVVYLTGINAAGDWYKLTAAGAENAWIAGFLISAPQCPAGFTLPVAP
jgi:PKD repeat protein